MILSSVWTFHNWFRGTKFKFCTSYYYIELPDKRRKRIHACDPIYMHINGHIYYKGLISELVKVCSKVWFPYTYSIHQHQPKTKLAMNAWNEELKLEDECIAFTKWSEWLTNNVWAGFSKLSLHEEDLGGRRNWPFSNCLHNENTALRWVTRSVCTLCIFNQIFELHCTNEACQRFLKKMFKIKQIQ